MQSTAQHSHASVEQQLHASNAGELFDVGELAEGQYPLEQGEQVDEHPATLSAARNDDQPKISRKRAAGARSPPDPLDASSAPVEAASQVCCLTCLARGARRERRNRRTNGIVLCACDRTRAGRAHRERLARGQASLRRADPAAKPLLLHLSQYVGSPGSNLDYNPSHSLLTLLSTCLEQKRTLQNRKAQREFRVRRAHYLKELEERVRGYESGGPGNVMEMQQTIAHLGRENQYLRNVTDRLQDELQAERAQSHSLHGQLLELHTRLQDSLASSGAPRQQGLTEGSSPGYQQQPTPARRLRLQALPQYSTGSQGNSQSPLGTSGPVNALTPEQTRGSWAMRPLPAFRSTLHGEPSGPSRQIPSSTYPSDTGESNGLAVVLTATYAAGAGLPVTPTTEIVSPFQRVVQLLPSTHAVERESASEAAPMGASQQDPEPHQTYSGLPDDLAEFSDPQFSLDTPPLSSPDLPLELSTAQQLRPETSASQHMPSHGQAMPSPGQADEIGGFGYFDDGDSRTVRFSSGEAPAPSHTWLPAGPPLDHARAHPTELQPTAPQRIPPTDMVTSWNPYVVGVTSYPVVDAGFTLTRPQQPQTSATLGYHTPMPASPAVGAEGAGQASWALPATADPMPSPPLYMTQHHQQPTPQSQSQSQSYALSSQQQYPSHVLARSIPQAKAPRQAYQRAPTPHPRPRPRIDRTISLQSIPTPAPSTSGLVDDISRPSTGSSVAFISSQPTQKQMEYSSISNTP